MLLVNCCKFIEVSLIVVLFERIEIFEDRTEGVLIYCRIFSTALSS